MGIKKANKSIYKYYWFYLLIIVLNELKSVDGESIYDLYNHRQHDHRAVSSNAIVRKLLPIEIYENVPIGYQLIDLKSIMFIDQQKSSGQSDRINSYFNFEFINDVNSNEDYVNAKSSLTTLKSYFILDPFAGTIQTAKSLDLENFCDLNLCQKTKISMKNNNNPTCQIPFTIKVTRYVSNKSLISQTYHIVFNLLVRDINEFAPQFEQKQALVFNVTEEFAPIKLPIGSVAHDNDCSDRDALYYNVKVLRINSRPADEFVSRNSELKKNDFGLYVEAKVEESLLFLCTDRALDSEEVTSIEMEIIASDRKDLYSSDARLGSLEVIINVADINDHTPKFENQVYNLGKNLNSIFMN
jgi:hypothetical protein